MKKILAFLAGLILTLSAYNSSAQTAQWFDDNGASISTNGNWDTNSANWADTSALTASTVEFTGGNFAIFSAGTAGIVNLTITVPAAVTCAGFGDATTSTGSASGAAVSNLTFTGAGSINLPAGTWPIECGNSAPVPSLFVNVLITGPGGIIQHNSGALYLDATNTYSGGTTITGGQLTYFSNSASFGTGPITFTGTQSLLNAGTSLVTLPNNWIMNNAGGVINFAGGNVTCTGTWTLMCSESIKNNTASNPLNLTGAIGDGGAGFGVNYQNTDATVGNAKITVSGPNTYTGQTQIGQGVVGDATTVSVASINSVANPAQQSSSSFGVPSSAATGVITFGNSASGTYNNELIYTGPGETSDRGLSFIGTTGGIFLEMDGAGPLVLTGPFTVTQSGSRTFTLQGSSTAANTIAGNIINGSGTVALTKAQAGTWELTGVNTYTGTTTVSAGTLVIGGSGALNNGTYAGAIALTGTLNYNSTVNQTCSGLLSGAGTLIQNGPGTLTLSDGSSTFTGSTTINPGTTLFVKPAAALKEGGAGFGPVTINGNGILSTIAGNGALENNSITSGASSTAGVVNLNLGTGNLYLTNNLGGFLGTFNVTYSAAGGQLVVGNGATYATAINAAATWNVAVGAVLDFNGLQTDPATIILNGVANPPNTSANNGALRVDGGSVQSGPVILMANSSIGNGLAAAGTISGVISDGGIGYGFTKVSANSIILSAANTYTGPTLINAGTLDISSTGSIQGSVTVNAGTLEMDNATAMTPASTLSVAASGAAVNLTYGSSQTIKSLFIGGIQQAPGVYGATAYNPGGIFTGSGTLTITTGGGASPVTISSAIVNNNNQLVISWNSVTGADYNVYTTPSLNPPVTWTLANTSPIPATGGSTTYTVPGTISGNLFVTVQQ